MQNRIADQIDWYVKTGNINLGVSNIKERPGSYCVVMGQFQKKIGILQILITIIDGSLVRRYL